MPELGSHCESSTRSADPIPSLGDHLFQAIPTTHSGAPEKVAAFRSERVVAFRRNQWPPSRRNRWPLSPGKRKRVRRDDALYVVGHPQGYPRVVHDNAFVYFPFQVTKFEFNELKLLVESEFLDDPKREERMAEFTSSYRPRVLPPPSNFTVYEDFNFRWGKQPTIGADADTYHGDSGSPVFSRASHLVVGIFFAGEADLDTPWNPGWAAHEAIIPVTAIVDQLDATLPSWRSSEGVCVKN